MFTFNILDLLLLYFICSCLLLSGDAAVCDVLLQCGADLYAQHNGLVLLDEAEVAARAEVKEIRLNQVRVDQNYGVCNCVVVSM